jgi:uncharacterized repeat protein (TIGR03803 family)
VFELKADGTHFVIMRNFAGQPSDGAAPYGGLVADGAGNLYGTTTMGGTANLGTVFSVPAVTGSPRARRPLQG